MKIRLSYAQNREDFIIAGFFPDVEVGHYVDIGAGHPIELSVTKLFYERGWSGLNVEPVPELAALLRADRPRDVTVEGGVADREGRISFTQYVGIGLSTFNADMIAEHEASDAPATISHVEYDIDVTTLDSLLRAHPLPHIHFMKIDVEGSEYEVLAGNDWNTFRPELLCIETDHMVRDWFPLLKAANYRMVFDDGLNAYFLAAEARHRAELFSFADDVLDGGYLVPPVVADELAAVVTERETVAQLRQDDARLEHDNAQLKLDNAQLELDNARLQAAKAQLQDEKDQIQSELVAETSLRAMYFAREAMVSARLAEVETYLGEVLTSRSWRLTKPVRVFMELLRRRAPASAIDLARRTRDRITSGDAEPGRLSPDGQRVLEDLELLAGIEADS
ncbi:MAG TPA: FkbM family methyltransferase [Aeromicrobium sp.]|nr:FkbM family methyltransferase [Aeromicrobium sp.]